MNNSDFVEIMKNYDFDKVDDLVTFATEIAHKITNNDVRYKSAQTYFVMTIPYALEETDHEACVSLLFDCYELAVKLYG